MSSSYTTPSFQVVLALILAFVVEVSGLATVAKSRAAHYADRGAEPISASSGSSLLQTGSAAGVGTFWESAVAAALNDIPASPLPVASTVWPLWKKHSQDEKKKKNHSIREQYMAEKLSIDMLAFDQVEKHQVPAVNHPRRAAHNMLDHGGKVAFIFMLMDQLSHEDIWVRFFQHQPKHNYSIYVHRAAVPESAEGEADFPLTKLGAISVPWVNSSWCALMGVEVAGLRQALADPLNKQFVFLSQDTVPLKRFSYVYDYLIADGSSDKSKFCLGEPALHKYAAVEQVSNELAQRCIFRDFYREIDPHVVKHHEWIVLSRDHAQVVSTRARDGIAVWEQAWKQAAPDLPTQGEGCSDESVPLTTLLLDHRQNHLSTGVLEQDLKSMGVEQQCMTFVNWYNCFQGSEFHLQGWGLIKSVKERSTDLYRYLFDDNFDFVHETKLNAFPTVYNKVTLGYLSTLVNHGFLFGRKFPPNVTVVLPNEETAGFRQVLSGLWENVDEDKARTMVWSRLEATFQPSATWK